MRRFNAFQIVVGYSLIPFIIRNNSDNKYYVIPLLILLIFGFVFIVNAVYEYLVNNDRRR